MSKKLAIKGHPTRGKEVIEILEMLGGKNIHKLLGSDRYAYYVIEGCQNEIRAGEYIFGDKYMYIFTLEEFLEKYPFKVGDKVHIYVQNDDIDGRCDIEATEITSMRWNPAIRKIAYKMKDINREFYKEEIKCKVDDFCRDYQIEEPNTVISGINLNSCNYADEVELNLGDYEIEVRDGRTYAVKKKPKYPTTYKECCDVLNLAWNKYFIIFDIDHNGLTDEENNLYESLIKLKRCRDAYWKIAGEEMGLGKTWKPVYIALEDNTYFTIQTFNGEIDKSATSHRNSVLAFPTIEMRDTFYENFKDLIEQCKELL